MRRLLFLGVCAAAVAVVVSPSTAAPQRLAPTSSYVVLYENGASLASARLAVRAAGGPLIAENWRVGVATATSSSPTFAADLLRQGAVAGVARNKPVGYNAPATKQRRSAEELTAAERATARLAKPTRACAGRRAARRLQWDMAMIHATPTGSYAREPGDQGVLVGVLDTGIDGTHPDIAPNFDAATEPQLHHRHPAHRRAVRRRARPLVQRPGERGRGRPRHACGRHDRRRRSTASASAGVAPNVTLVNLRAGQDSGFFFLQPSVDALTYAGDIGVDVVNMSFFIDPWLYNCPANPADSPRRSSRSSGRSSTATQRALDYAHKHGVTLVAAAGNEHTDLGNPTIDDDQPRLPAGHRVHAQRRQLVPDDADRGHRRDRRRRRSGRARQGRLLELGRRADRRHRAGRLLPRRLRDAAATARPATRSSAPYPRTSREANGDPRTRTARRTRRSSSATARAATCAYYQYLQGTSMASPHAVGVAALIVSQFGHPDRRTAA